MPITITATFLAEVHLVRTESGSHVQCCN